MVQTNNELKVHDKRTEDKKTAKQAWMEKNVPLIIGFSMFGFIALLSFIMYLSNH